MKKVTRKVMALALVCAMSCSAAVLAKQTQKNEAKAYAGLAYYASERGMSNEATFGIGAVGAFEGALHGAICGSVFGGPIGFGVGLCVSL